MRNEQLLQTADNGESTPAAPGARISDTKPPPHAHAQAREGDPVNWGQKTGRAEEADAIGDDAEK